MTAQASSSSPLDLVLSRLDKVRKVGPDRYHSRCPAHEDRTPTLSIRELPDTRVLLHCFAGCSVDAVLVALDLEFADLYPPKPKTCKPERRPFPALDVLRAIYVEALVVLAAACEIRRRGFLKDPDIARLDLAVQRISDGMTAAEGTARRPH